MAAKADLAVSWSASDADAGAALRVSLDYSSDGGTSWRTVAIETNSGVTTLERTLLTPSDRARLRLRVSDGFDETWVVSDRFAVSRRPPTVSISSPRRGKRFLSSDSVYLSATAYDDADEFLDGRSITWLDGKRVIGTGRLASASSLAPGAHTIRARARDARGRAAEASVRIVVTGTAPGIVVTSGPARVSRTDGAVRIRLFCTAPAAMTITERRRAPSYRGRCDRREGTVSVPIRPGRGNFALELRAQAYGRSSTVTLILRRP